MFSLLWQFMYMYINYIYTLRITSLSLWPALCLPQQFILITQMNLCSKAY